MNAVISTLRSVVPMRALTYTESLGIAELQASKLLALIAATKPPLPEAAISGLPRVQVERMSPAPMSGATQWSHGRWLIILNGSETRGRQRFSLAHEFKHVLDNPFIDVIYPAKGGMTSGDRAEQICDYFAACLLIPRLWLKRAWTDGEQSTRLLARQFDVSQAAMGVRLRQIGLVESTERCEPPQRIARVAA
jgi:Zn-dependent peptidase ImmA (M78 family)